MYEEYMQNFFNYPMNDGYKNTYEQGGYYNCGVNCNQGYDFNRVEDYPYSYNNQNYNYIQNYQNRNNNMEMQELENYYPEIYKVLYPMVKKVCAKNNRNYGKETIDRMVEEVYSNIEANDATMISITLNNDVRGVSKERDNEEKENRDEVKEEKRQIRRNSGLNDLIRILILRELLGRPGGCFGPNCRPGFRPNPRPPMPPRPFFN